MEDFQRMSEDALLLEIVRKEFQQVAGVVLVIVVDVGEEVVQPLARIDLCQFAASHKGVDDGSVLGGIMVSAEEIVLAYQSQRPHVVLDEIIVYMYLPSVV